VKLLLDIDIVLDVVLNRAPWAADAAVLLTAVEEGRANGFIAGHTITTIRYIIGKATDRTGATHAVSDLLRLLDVVPLGRADFQQALAPGLGDFEDAVQATAALRIGADYLVTRNEPDFRGIPVPIRTAGEILALI
jgi:predicted nucleic acid-binding protein